MPNNYNEIRAISGEGFHSLSLRNEFAFQVSMLWYAAIDYIIVGIGLEVQAINWSISNCKKDIIRVKCKKEVTSKEKRRFKFDNEVTVGLVSQNHDAIFQFKKQVTNGEIIVSAWLAEWDFE